MAENGENDQVVFTEAEAAEILKITPNMLAKRRRARKIACIKDGHFIGYTRQHLLEYQTNFQRHSSRSLEVIDPETLLAVLKKRLSRTR